MITEKKLLSSTHSTYFLTFHEINSPSSFKPLQSCVSSLLLLHRYCQISCRDFYLYSSVVRREAGGVLQRHVNCSDSSLIITIKNRHITAFEWRGFGLRWDVITDYLSGWVNNLDGSSPFIILTIFLLKTKQRIVLFWGELLWQWILALMLSDDLVYSGLSTYLNDS